MASSGCTGDRYVESNATNADESTLLAVDAVIAERYIVHGVLAETTMSSVYEGSERATGVRVVLNVSKRARRGVRFIDKEAAVLQSVTHAALPRLRDVGVLTDGRAYVSLEFIAGRTLWSWIAKRQACVRDVLAVATRVADALGALHRVGQLHRDVKPHNIIVPECDGRPQYDAVVLLDLGIAASLEVVGARARTEVGHVEGTLLYMAPEQFMGAAQTVATDVYALGATLFTMLYGRPIRTMDGISRAKLSDSGLRVFVGPGVIRCVSEEVDIPDGEQCGIAMRGVIGRMLRRAPGERPQSMAEVLRGLHAMRSQRACDICGSIDTSQHPPCV
jgi:serine/threonine protein kinase